MLIGSKVEKKFNIWPVKKHSSILLLLLLASTWCIAQPDNLQLIGTLKTETNQLIPLKLTIDVQPGGEITGISTTNFLNEDRTESRITGKINFEKQMLEFSEIGNVSTSSDAKANEFCYIRVKNLHWRQNQEKSIFNGQFNGFFPDSSLCASGEIYLVNSQLLRKMVENNKRLRDIRDSLKQAATSGVQDTAITARVDPDAPLQNAEVLSLAWHSNQVKLQVWDGFKEDNDRIAIYVNDSLRHKSVVAAAHKKTFQFDFENEKVLTIKIVAENEGSQPPNTVNTHLIDAGKVHPLSTKLKKGEFVEVRLLKSKE
ncbi:MAG: hypothetical protein CMI36_10445 [Owenweeksia sp.]|nr:hypothetical protein [Owenweeksia sp.]MBF99400.1 hypothetical protein [Owenweeksia sp.]HBF20673.1 hypothetical protein [Cryomorphaceae bacterium]HCQ16585.1 hypothetical protein [Cryomorphaceae bacterium]|tara:strand:+ start:205 stop:1146 length:942 start_codon:yes stop_codon:yes gene_type:complete